MVLMPASRGSFTNRSCSVEWARSTRPLAWLVLSHRISMLSSDKARPNRVMPSPLAAFSPRYPKDRMLVGIERNRFAMLLQIALQSFEIGKRALGWNEAELHQSAGGMIDEH